MEKPQRRILTGIWTLSQPRHFQLVIARYGQQDLIGFDIVGAGHEIVED